jgi:hypothetical protein
MTNMKLLLAAPLLFVIGCSTTEYNVESDYRPLKQIRERPEFLAPDTTITTVGDTIYVANLKNWLADNEPGSLVYRSKLKHEQVHSIRQSDKGLAEWLAKYMTDTSFMWAEEQRGWYEEIMTIRTAGLNVNPAEIAVILKGYKNLVGKMVSFDDALVWVQAVISGSWKPAPK